MCREGERRLAEVQIAALACGDGSSLRVASGGAQDAAANFRDRKLWQ